MVGEASGIVPDRGLNILNRVTMNTLMNLTDAGLTRNNYGANTQATANTRLSADTPNGILAGQVVKVGTVSGTVVIATGASGEVAVGFAINNAVGYPFESSSGVASGKCPYIHGTGTVFSTDLYETFRADAATPVVFTPGAKCYVSQNGMLCTEQLNSQPAVGVVLIAPSATDPFMVVQSLI
jgi:hypothetical protein